MRHGKVVRRYWGSIATTRPQFQVALLDSAREAVVAKGHAIPIAWSGDVGTLPDGIDAVLKEGLLNPPTRPTTLCALAVVVAPEERGRGLSALVLEAMRGVAARCGLRDLIAPVVWTLGLVGNRIFWRGEVFHLKKGRLERIADDDTVQQELSRLSRP